MVRLSYQDIDATYEQIKRSACGRQACSVMVLVANEVDAMAATRMLTQLLRIDNIAYAVRPVTNFSQVMQNYRKYVTPEIKTIILVNCGAMHNIPKAFDLEQGGETRCFILDNHRPFHLANIHSRHNVVIFDDSQEIDDDHHNGVIPSDGSESSGASDDDTSEEDDDEEEAEDTEDNAFSDAEEEFEDGDGDEEEKGEREDENSVDGDAEEERKSSEDEVENTDETDAVTAVDEKAEDGGYEGGDDDVAAGDDDNEGVESGAGVDERRLSEATSNEEEGDEAEDIDTSKLGSIPQPEDNGDDEDEVVRVVGRRRKALAEQHDPARVRRRRLREYYVRPAGYSVPTAMMIMNLVWGRNGSHVPLDLVWQAVLGTTDQYHRARIDHGTYTSICQYLTVLLGEHLTSASERVRYVVGDGTEEEVVAQGAETGHIQEVQEFRFFMHRHWSLFDSMYHSPYIASKMPVWQAHGTAKLQELLAKMGMPLDACRRQSYNTIRADLRPHFKQQLLNEAVQADYNLKNPDIIYQSFSRFNSFKNPVGASDVVVAASTLLEMCRNDDSDASRNDAAGGVGDLVAPGAHGISRQQAFNDAYDCLGTGARAEELLRKGVQATLVLQRMLVKKAAIMLEGHDSISRLNRLYFAYAYQAAYVTGSVDGGPTSAAAALVAVSSSSSGSGAAAPASNAMDTEMDAPFTRPHVLTRLGQYIMEVKRNLSKKQGGWAGRKGLLPLILVAERRDSYLVVGISPLATAQGRGELSDEDVHAISLLTNFRQFFQLACKEIRIRPLSEAFDANAVEVAKEDVHDFLGTLDFLLKRATPDHFRQ